MNASRKYWLMLGVALLALLAIACSISSLVPQNATPTPYPTVEILPTQAEVAPPMQGLAGYWLDPETTGTTTTISAYGDGFVAESVINPNRGTNELTSTNWSNGVLTWTYCVPNGACVTNQTISINGDNLEISWSNDQGDSGFSTMTRATGVPQVDGEAVPGMAGMWLDPDANSRYYVILWQGDEYVVTESVNPKTNANEITSSSWDGTTLTWTYCVPDGACVTTETLGVDGDSLYTSWSNDQGKTGSTTLQRMP